MQTQSYVPAGLLVVMSICTEMSRETLQLWDVQDSFVFCMKMVQIFFSKRWEYLIYCRYE